MRNIKIKKNKTKKKKNIFYKMKIINKYNKKKKKKRSQRWSS